MPATGGTLDLLKKLFVIRVIIDRVNLRGIDDQQWAIVIVVEKPGIGIRQTLDICALDKSNRGSTPQTTGHV